MHEIEQEVFGFTHMDVGGTLVKQWHLSEDLEHVILYHHDLERAAEAAPDAVEVISIVSLADDICDSCGIGTGRGALDVAFEDHPALLELDLEPEDVEEHAAAIKELVNTERRMFG